MYSYNYNEVSIHATNCLIISMLILEMYRCIVISNFLYIARNLRLGSRKMD